METMILLVSPFAPHIASELWEKIGNKDINLGVWPKYDPGLIKKDNILVVIQVNGKLRSKIEVPSDLKDSDIKDMACRDVKAVEHIGGKQVKKVIYVPGKLVNIVV